jgi:hypothetical protein
LKHRDPDGALPKWDEATTTTTTTTTIYKLVSAVINNRLTEKISFHDAIHGFRTKRGTGTALIEAKLRM